MLTVIVGIGGLASFLGTRLLVSTFRESAVSSEQAAAVSARLRSDIIAHAVVFVLPITDPQQLQVLALQATTRADFAEALQSERSAAARALLEQARQKWETVVGSAGTRDHPTDVVTRGAAVSIDDPAVLVALDQAGSAGRAAVRADLARAADIDHLALAVLALLGVLAVAVALRMSRRLSREVLRPVGLLRDSANHLAAGRFDHRIVVDRSDELGELALSFNAMADAISGSQRSLTLEANTDSLTGLANRAAFRERLDAALGRPVRRVASEAVLFVDLDDFKDVNDTLGHAAGDELLRHVARRLSDAVRPDDLVARLGGDEFAVLLVGLTEPELAFGIAERIVAALADPVEIGDSWARVGVSVGLAARRGDSTAEGLMREADVAMYAAKAKGKNRVERYDANLDDVAVARDLLRADLDAAVSGNQLVVEYQPVVDLHTGGLVGLEALVRWQHPTRGLLPPLAFVDLAEQSGAINDIGAWVLETASRQLRRWQRRYSRPDLWISVNVSMRQLDTLGFEDLVKVVLETTGLDPGSLVLEVTESILADPNGGAAQVLANLRVLGARIALDDFGTGSSTIGYLRQLPVDLIKIDRSLVSDCMLESPDPDLLDAIVAMAHHLGLEVIPEGIEDAAQLDRLRGMGCRIGQGFLLAHPMATDAVEELLFTPSPLPDMRLYEAELSGLATT